MTELPLALRRRPGTWHDREHAFHWRSRPRRHRLHLLERYAMTLSIALVLSLGAAAVVLFASGWLRMDLVALMVLCALAVAGLVRPDEALAGFSSPAVVIVWTMFVLSAGLSRTGVGELLGRPLQRLARHGERALVVGLMAVASLLSALMNTVSVASILLPVTMDLARRRRCSPSRLLLPMALGCLMGAPFTAVSAASNILINDALRVAGLQPFGLFDFAPPTALIVAAGMTFVAIAGRRLLPDRAAPVIPGAEQLGRWYGLREHAFTTRLAPGSPLAGKTIGQCRLGSALHLTVLAIVRGGRLELAPGPGELLRECDVLLLHGHPDHQRRLHGRQHLLVAPASEAAQALGRHLVVAEAQVSSGSPLAGVSVSQTGLRTVHGCHLLAVRRHGGLMHERLQQLRLEAGDVLLLQGQAGRLQRLVDVGLAEGLRLLQEAEARDLGVPEVLGVRVPPGSVLVEHSLKDSDLGRGFGLTVLGIVREADLVVMPHPDEPIRANDLLLVLGSSEDLVVLNALQALELRPIRADDLAELESLSVGVLEAVLAPRASVAGKTLGELRFRELYGLTVLAVWREGQALRDGLADLALRYGDALLVHGSRARLEVLASDPDFLVLDREAAQAPRLERATMAGVIVAGVLTAAMAGWLPVEIAALVGVVLMVLTRILSMDETYRAIDWRAVFLIAGMLPLGTALQQTGAAQLLATQLIGLVGGFGPRTVIAALFLVTVAATQVLPSPVLVVIMAPIALTAAKTLSLSPYPLLMTVALASAANFATPTAHAALVLVMGPGCYRFVDYMKLGVPLTLVAFVVVVLLVPVMWPP